MNKKNIKKIIKYNTNKTNVIKLSFGKATEDFVEVKVNPTISFEKYSQFINDAVEFVFPNGDYNAFLHSSVLDILKIRYFTDIKEEDAELLFALSNTTDIIDKIDNIIGTKMVDKIDYDYNEAISYYQNVLVHTSEWDSVAVEIATLLSKFADNADTFKNVDLNKILGVVDTLAKNKEEVVSKVIDLHRDTTKQ